MGIHNAVGWRAAARLMLGLCALWAVAAVAQVKDPGVRKTSADGGPPAALPGLSPQELEFYKDGLARFMETDMGIDPKRLMSASRGEHEPVADNKTDGGKKQNRRVEIVVVIPHDAAVSLAK